MYELYEQGATLQEVGDEFGITRERVRQVFGKAGLETRSLTQAALIRRETDRERSEEIVESFLRLKSPRLTARELEIAENTVRSVLREQLSSGEYRVIARKQPKQNYSDQELIAFLREASAAGPTVMTALAYGDYARSRRTADGRPWPTHQTHHKRFGSWRGALMQAGLPAHAATRAGRKRHFDADLCVQALRAVHDALGKVPSTTEYERYAHDSQGALPSSATVRNRCGTWNDALRMAGL
ncbi:MAG TPA: sigma factor-like helix-turn-helix DNA-binding protein [Solirubrobacteraceae bacterium]